MQLDQMPCNMIGPATVLQHHAGPDRNPVMDRGMADHVLPPDMPAVTKRRHAKAAGASHYFTGKECKRGHLALRFVSTGQCVECQLMHGRASYAANPERHAGYHTKWREKNLEYARGKGREWYRANAEELKERQRSRYAANRDILRAEALERYRTNRERNIERMRQYAVNNKSREYERKATYRAANREAAVAYAIAYAKENPEWAKAQKQKRRARKMAAGGFFTAAEIKDLYRKQKGGCPVCKTSLADGYHVDHVQPLAKGGTNDIKNIQLLCPRCNHTKSDKDPIEFMQSRGFLL